MKRKIIFAVLILLCPLTVHANSIKLDCPKSIAPKSEFTCKITGTTNMNITGVAAKIQVSDSLKLVSVITDNSWQGDGKNGDIAVYTADEVTGDFNIGTIRLKSNDNNNDILINSIFFYDDKVKEHQIESVSVNIPVDKEQKETKIDSDAESNQLVDLEIENYSIDFEKQKNEYEIKIGNEEKLDIKPILEDDTATYEIEGNKNLTTGSKVKIKVTTASGEEKTYILNIIKEKKSKKVTMFFVIFVVILILINMVRIISNKTNRGKKNEK